MSEKLARKLRTLAFQAMLRKQISWFDRYMAVCLPAFDDPFCSRESSVGG